MYRHCTWRNSPFDSVTPEIHGLNKLNSHFDQFKVQTQPCSLLSINQCFSELMCRRYRSVDVCPARLKHHFIFVCLGSLTCRTDHWTCVNRGINMLDGPHRTEVRQPCRGCTPTHHHHHHNEIYNRIRDGALPRKPTGLWDFALKIDRWDKKKNDVLPPRTSQTLQWICRG